MCFGKGGILAGDAEVQVVGHGIDTWVLPRLRSPRRRTQRPTLRLVWISRPVLVKSMAVALSASDKSRMPRSALSAVLTMVVAVCVLSMNPIDPAGGDTAGARRPQGPPRLPRRSLRHGQPLGRGSERAGGDGVVPPQPPPLQGTEIVSTEILSINKPSPLPRERVLLVDPFCCPVSPS